MCNNTYMNIQKCVYLFIGLLGYLFIGSILTPSANAQEQVRSFTISPPTLTVPTAPGKSAEGVMKIRNETDSPVTFTARVQDFIVSDTRGTPTILPADTLSNKYSASSWIGISPTKFTVAPNQRQEISYFIQIPRDAKPGGHYAAIVYEPTSAKGVDSSGATVNSQIGTLFSITIDGPIKENALVTKLFTPFFQEYGPVAIQTQIKNLGDEHIKPLGTVTVTNMLGGKEMQPLHENNIFPEAARDYANIMGQKWMFGRYEASFQATYGRGNILPLSATMVFWVFPWKLFIVIILIIIAAILGYMLMKKQGKDQVPPADPSTGFHSDNSSERAGQLQQPEQPEQPQQP